LSEDFSEIVVNKAEVRFCCAKKEHVAIKFDNGFVIYHKNFLEIFLIFWFILYQDKMNGQLKM